MSEFADLKKTPLYTKHIENNAKMINFCGWNLPLEYSSSLEEARQVRLNCGLFDVSHMGQIRIRGKDAFNFLQKLVSNDLALITEGQLQYNLFIDRDGGIVDDLMVYNLGDEFFCVVNAVNIQKDFNWLQNLADDNEVTIIDESYDTALLSLQGPKAYLVLEEIFGQIILKIPYMHFKELILDDKKILLSRSGYTGEDGFEMYCNRKDAVFLWDLILSKAKKFNIKLCGLGARDILRIEAGYPLYGHEIDQNMDPFTASLEWVVKFNKDFLGKQSLLKLKDTTKYKRVGFVMKEPAFARKDYEIFDSQKLIGRVTSGAYSPNLEKFIGMASVLKEIQIGTEVQIKIRDKFYKAKIVSFSFIKRVPPLLQKMQESKKC